MININSGFIRLILEHLPSFKVCFRLSQAIVTEAFFKSATI
jgi:hypothetical protein